MSELSAALGNFGPLHELEWEGKKYPVRYIGQDIKTGFEMWLFKKDRQAEEIGKELISQEEYQKRLEALNRKYVLGYYSWGEKLADESLHSKAGMLQLCCLMFDISEMDMVRLFTAKGQEVLALVDLVLKESVPEAKANPNRQRQDVSAA